MNLSTILLLHWLAIPSVRVMRYVSKTCVLLEKRM